MRFKLLVAVLAVMLGLGAMSAVAQECPPGFDCTGYDQKISKAVPVELTTITIRIDETKTSAQLIEDGGYEWVDLFLEENPPPIRAGHDVRRADIILLDFGGKVTTDQVLKQMVRLHVRPADTQEILSLGTYPFVIPGKRDIAALGAIRFSPYLGEYGIICLGNSKKAEKRPVLLLPWYGFKIVWDEHYLFAAVREQ